MKKFRLWAIAGAMALLLAFSSAGTVSAMAEESAEAEEKVLVEGLEWDADVVSETVEAKPVNLNDVTAKEVIVESGNACVVEINGGSIDKISVLPAQLDVIDSEKIATLLEYGMPVSDVMAMYQNYLKEKELVNTLKPTVKLAGGAVIDEVAVSGSAVLNMAGGEVEEVFINNENNSDRLLITIQNYNGKVNVNQHSNADGTHNLLNVKLENSNLSELNVTGEDKCVLHVGGDDTSKVAALNVNGALDANVLVNADNMRVTEGAENSSVRIYSDVENVVVEADNSKLSLAASATVENAKVEGDNVKVAYTGKIKNAEILGKGSVMDYVPVTTEAPKPTEAPIPTGEIIGKEDCSTGWWTAFSDTVKVEVGTTEKITFWNITGGLENWHNFVVVLQNVADAHSTGDNANYLEYAAVRADNYGWGNGYITAKLQSNWNWDTFKKDMDGAVVELAITNHGTKADVVANIKTAKGKTYYQKYTGIAIDGDLYYCLTVEGGYLVIPGETETPEEPTPDTPEEPTPDTPEEPTPEEPAGIILGNEDFSTPWWTVFSDAVNVENGATETVTFKNFTNGLNNWNNFVVVLKNAAGDKEYAVMRADNWGWLDGNPDNPIADSGKESNWNWDTFKSDLNGATVVLTVTNNGTTADVVANVTTAAGNTYFQKYTGIAIDGDLSYCLTVDGCYLVIEEAEDTPEEPTPDTPEEPTPDTPEEPTPDTPEEPTPDTPEEPESIILGNEDFSTPWWTVFSDAVNVENGATETVTFKNFTNGVNNWNNFVVVLKNAAGDKEYAVMRADNWGWLDGNPDNPIPDSSKASNWNWDTFKSDLNGATVVLTVTNNGTTADVVANITTAAGNTYFQKYTGIAIDGDLVYCLTVDGCYLVFEETEETPEEPTPDTPEEPGTPDTPEEPESIILGNEDCSTPWWTVFSDAVNVENGATETVTFKNFTNGATNWNNFLVVLKNQAGDKEYAVMRADNYGWSGALNTGANLAELGWTVESNWNWDTFTTDMNGATVVLTVTNNGTTADVVANITTAAGNTHFQKYTGIAITDGDLSYCLTVEGGYLEIEQ